MIDYYLRCGSEPAARALLRDAGLLTEEGPAERVTLDMVGIITEGGEWDAAGNAIAEPTPLPGWHVNVRTRGPLSAAQLQALGPVQVAPAAPVRVFG